METAMLWMGTLSAKPYSPEENSQPGFSLSEGEWLQETPGRSRTDAMSLMIGKLKSI